MILLNWVTMDEADRKDLTYLVREIIDSEFEDSDWRQVEHALTLMEQSRGADDEDWTVGRNVLFNLLKENRTARGLRNTLPVRTDKPVPQPVRDRFVQLLHKVGHVPRQEQRVDDSA
ncbi:hypothetical protein LADH09A_006097 [Micromonospora sp. LAH09]|uniref:CATRA system-associated protein n=1 Tax=Micromonospora cabrerizensis TaxID=2911213 RepID=UPI001EE8C52C|nr:CATRA system-associated protein [Micromonospora cabrerizensis]MCG5472062.1 hypothetical protein [Micromonospora cabrerizensis]